MDEVEKEDLGSLFFRFSPGAKVQIGTNIVVECTLVKNKNGDIRKVLRVTAPRSMKIKKISKEEALDAGL